MRCTDVFIGIWWPMEPLGFGEVSSFGRSLIVREQVPGVAVVTGVAVTIAGSFWRS